MKPLCRVVAGVAVLGLCALPATAQTSAAGRIRGSATVTQGAALPGATLTAASPAPPSRLQQ